MAIIFNIQRFSVQDGPGIRTTVFFKGCPLRCLWCSNPESQDPNPEVAHRDSLCNKCGRCLDICPVHAISLTEKGIQIDRTTCDNCGRCVEACIPQAIKIYGQEMSVEQVFEEVKRDMPFYADGGGGVTASGGEPLLQADFVARLFKQCRDAGIHTCIETSGFAEPDSWDKVLPVVDLILYDLKLMDASKHLEVTARQNEKILQNLKYIAGKGVPVIIRIPIIPGINDSTKNIEETALFIKEVAGIKEVNILPYHRFGESKYNMLDSKYGLSELTPPADNQLEEIVRIFGSFGMHCEIVR